MAESNDNSLKEEARASKPSEIASAARTWAEVIPDFFIDALSNITPCVICIFIALGGMASFSSSLPDILGGDIESLGGVVIVLYLSPLIYPLVYVLGHLSQSLHPISYQLNPFNCLLTQDHLRLPKNNALSRALIGFDRPLQIDNLAPFMAEFAKDNPLDWELTVDPTFVGLSASRSTIRKAQAITLMFFNLMTWSWVGLLIGSLVNWLGTQEWDAIFSQLVSLVGLGALFFMSSLSYVRASYRTKLLFALAESSVEKTSSGLKKETESRGSR